MIGHKPAAEAIAADDAAAHRGRRAVDIQPDDLGLPEAAAGRGRPARHVCPGAARRVRPARLSAHRRDGAPISRWWPIAYAFRRVGDPRAGAVLLALLQGEGTMTRAFAARGLGAIKEARAVTPLDRRARQRRAKSRSCGSKRHARSPSSRHRPAADALMKILTTQALEPNLRLEAVTALGQLGAPGGVRSVDRPGDRPLAVDAIGRADGAGARRRRHLCHRALRVSIADPHWSVRAALATALGALGARARHAAADADARRLRSARRAGGALGARRDRGARRGSGARSNGSTAEDPVVRQAAVNGLARLKSAKASSALLNGLRHRGEGSDIRGARGDAERARRARRRQCGTARSSVRWAIATGPIRVRAATLLRTLDPAADRAEMRPAPAAALAELNDLPPLINPDRVADGLHRHREGDDPDRARGARRAADGDQLRLARASAASSARRRFTASCRTSSCRTAIRAATAKAGRATRFATRSTSCPTCAGRSAWRSIGKTPAAASSSSRWPAAASRRPLHGLRPRGCRNGSRRSADAVAIRSDRCGCGTA